MHREIIINDFFGEREQAIIVLDEAEYYRMNHRLSMDAYRGMQLALSEKCEPYIIECKVGTVYPLVLWSECIVCIKKADWYKILEKQLDRICDLDFWKE
jgi:hypothetical protein